MSDAAQRLLDMKEQMGKAKTDRAKVKGQIIGVEGQMVERFDAKTTTAAEKKLKTMTAKRSTLQKALDKGVSDLENAHDWD